MINKQKQQRLSLRQSRDVSKIQRLIKFIELNNPVKITKESKQILSRQQFSYSNKKSWKKGIINEAINDYLDKKVEKQRQQNREASLQCIKKSRTKQKQSRHDTSGKAFFPTIKTSKTQQNTSSFTAGEEVVSDLVRGKKYDSLLLLPKQAIKSNERLGNKYINPKGKTIRQEKSRVQQKHRKTEIVRLYQIEKAKQIRYTGWESGLQPAHDFDFSNY